MSVTLQESELANEVWECLRHVTDPELDEPVTDMGFVENISVNAQGNKVEVEFRLPTYWCSPNFAFLMAFDIRNAIADLPWVGDVNVTLNDHCFADRVNEGVNGRRDFSSVFSEYCDGEDLSVIRLKFLEKAFIRRQEAVLLGLRAKGHSSACIVNMSLETLDAVHFSGCEAAKQKPRYRSLLVSRGMAEFPRDLAFLTWEGNRLTETGLRDYLACLRGVRINMEFNGALCRGLQATRYKEVEIGPDGPTLIDFIHNRVRARKSSEDPGAIT